MTCEVAHSCAEPKNTLITASELIVMKPFLTCVIRTNNYLQFKHLLDSYNDSLSILLALQNMKVVNLK